MTQMTITGSVDPLVTVYLQAGDSVYAERNAMVAMDAALSLTGGAKGGLLSSLARKVLNDETFFQQKITATDTTGEVLLTPTLPGDVCILDVGQSQYMISDGAYLASTEGVELEVKSQSLGRALLGDSGGLFVMKTNGQGQVAVSGFGSMRKVDLDGQKEVFVDNGHLVAWDAQLKYELALNTSKKGFFGKLLHSQTTGEGIVLKFSGRGSLYVCSRNKGGLLDWILSSMPQDKTPKND